MIPLVFDKTHQPTHTGNYKRIQSGSMLGFGIVWKICHIKFVDKINSNEHNGGWDEESLVTHGSYQMINKQKNIDWCGHNNTSAVRIVSTVNIHFSNQSMSIVDVKSIDDNLELST